NARPARTLLRRLSHKLHSSFCLSRPHFLGVRFFPVFVLSTSLLYDRFIANEAVMTPRLNSYFLILTFSFSLAAVAAERAISIPVQIKIGKHTSELQSRFDLVCRLL